MRYSSRLRSGTVDFGVAWLAVALLGCGAAHAQLRIVSYNTLKDVAQPSLSVVLRAIGEESRNGIAKPIDVLLLQETNGSAGETQQIVTTLNGIYGAGVYARGTVDGMSDDPNDRQTIIYNTQTVDLRDERAFGTLSPSGAARQTLRYQLRPVGYDDPASLYVYNSHYKSGQGTDAGGTTSNADRRNAEAIATRGDADALGEGSHVIYAGDHNFYDYGSSEPAWGALAAAGPGQAFDPMNRVGPWQSNPLYADVHTRSPCLSGCIGEGGGMDNRFDFQLVSGELLDGEGLSYLEGSYHAFGNNGSTFADNINSATNTVTFPSVTSYTKQQILDALRASSDHLPVVADYQVPAVLEAVLGNYPTMLPVGQTFFLPLTVRNAAGDVDGLVVAENGADELNYSIRTQLFDGALMNFSRFDQVAMPLEDGNLYQMQLDTSTPGVKSDVIEVPSSSQGAQNDYVEIAVSYNVVAANLYGDYNQNNVVDAADYTMWRDHLGAFISLPNEDSTATPGQVTMEDYVVWKAHFGQALPVGGAATAAAVPEPSAQMLAVVAACLALWRPGRLKGWTRKK